MKYIIAFVCLFSCFLLSNTATIYYTYRPMTQKTINFGDDVCYYKDISNDSGFAYVKPCEEGKECVALGSSLSDYAIAICQERSNEEYDNEGLTCETKAYLMGLDCTGYSCNSESKCYGICPKNQVYDYKNAKCIDDPGMCYEYDYDSSGNPTNSYLTIDPRNHYYKNEYTPYGNKKCVQLELERTGSPNTIYQVKKQLSNYEASIDDGKYIADDDDLNILFCKSGYALYFYGNEKLENPNKDSNGNPKSSEKLYLRCVTVLGKDKNGIIKYKIGKGDEKFYNPETLRNSKSLSLPGNNDHLMLKLGFFKNYKERLDKLGCRETGDCEDFELCKWKYFYENPEKYYLYQNEPQVLEFLMQTELSGCKFKAKHTSSNGSNYLSNIKYLTLLSLLLLF